MAKVETKVPVLEVRGISKRFPGVLANDNVSFSLHEGEIHAILGENGAGKSTLLNIIYGLYHPDSGDIMIDGQKVMIHSSLDAIRRGIGMVHQHFMLVPVFTVTENMVLGSEVTLGGGVLDMRKARKQIVDLSNQYGLKIDPDALVEDIPVGVQQRVEILKALYRGAKILFLDEPTAVLTPQEVSDLFKIMHQLCDRGVSIVFITHKLKEVLEIADRITVMRRGKVVGSTIPSVCTDRDLANMMVGREVMLQVDRQPAHPKEVVLSVRNLTVREMDAEVVKDISFEVHEGEILGIAGVQGNGQTQLAEAITGLRSAAQGEVWLSDHKMPYKNPRNLIEHGMAHIPEDRHKHGLVLPYTLADNLVLCTYYREPFAVNGTRNDKAILDNALGLIKRFDVRAPGPNVPAATLSGGNQQKLIVARELSRPVKLLIANQPTRGLDVGSIEYIHRQIVDMRDTGIGVLLVSAELDEIMALSDRIAVMYRGQIVAVVNAADTTREELGLLMAGSTLKH
jgi:ABC-type uncharacterized transport system ATPase subunit